MKTDQLKIIYRLTKEGHITEEEFLKLVGEEKVFSTSIPRTTTIPPYTIGSNPLTTTYDQINK